MHGVFARRCAPQGEGESKPKGVRGRGFRSCAPPPKSPPFHCACAPLHAELLPRTPFGFCGRLVLGLGMLVLVGEGRLPAFPLTSFRQPLRKRCARQGACGVLRFEPAAVLSTSGACGAFVAACQASSWYRPASRLKAPLSLSLRSSLRLTLTRCWRAMGLWGGRQSQEGGDAP